MSPVEETQRREFHGRAVCYRCHKPQLTCICGHLRRVANRTRVWLAQHPRERFHPIGTARIARLGLGNVHLEVLHSRAESPPPSLPARAALLYPVPRARELAALPLDERPEALVVIDGTWAHAHTLYRDNLWLQRLPHVQLTPEHESRYRLRKEPAAQCISTIEAIVAALRILEPDTPGLDGLLASFDAMIDQQIALIDQHRSGRRQPKGPPSLQGAPRCCLEEPERIVVVDFEAARRSPGQNEALAILQCAAIRVATGEVFQQFVRPPEGRFPTPRHLQHMDLDPQLLEAGSTPRELREAWHRFVASDDIVVAWNNSVLEVLDSAVGLPLRRVHLKSAYRSHAKQVRGPLSALIEQLQLEPSAPRQLVGRTGKHIAEIVALLTYLQTRAAR